jgi:3-hydroxyisobutyrate dehydrogenase-like beta-hydroxyacid dehydrogenase
VSAGDRERVGFVGLGAMGSVLAEALLDAGQRLAIFDERAEAMRQLTERGAEAARSAAELGETAATLLVSLPTPDAVRDVASAIAGGSAVRAFVDLSTTGSHVAGEVETVLHEAGIAYLDAPVSGGVAGARARKLTIMASGDRDLFTELLPLLETFGEKISWVGPRPGQGQLAKLLNNLLSATALIITSEAMTFGMRAGLDPETLLEIFNASTGRNTATSDKFPKHVLPRSFGAGFRLKLMAKDVELCMSEAADRKIPFVLGGVVQQLWTLAAARADESADVTEIVRLFEEWTGVTVQEGAVNARA